MLSGLPELVRLLLPLSQFVCVRLSQLLPDSFWYIFVPAPLACPELHSPSRQTPVYFRMWSEPTLEGSATPPTSIGWYVAFCAIRLISSLLFVRLFGLTLGFVHVTNIL